MNKKIWYEVGDMTMRMTALAELEIEYYEENGDEDDAIAYWTEVREKWMDRFVDWLHMDSEHEKPMAECYLTALEIVNDAKKYVDESES